MAWRQHLPSLNLTVRCWLLISDKMRSRRHRPKRHKKKESSSRSHRPHSNTCQRPCLPNGSPGLNSTEDGDGLLGGTLRDTVVPTFNYIPLLLPLLHPPSLSATAKPLEKQKKEEEKEKRGSEALDSASDWGD